MTARYINLHFTYLLQCLPNSTSSKSSTIQTQSGGWESITLIKKQSHGCNSWTTISTKCWNYVHHKNMKCTCTGKTDSSGDDRWKTLVSVSFHDLMAKIFASSWRIAGNLTNICEPSFINSSSSNRWTPWLRRYSMHTAVDSIPCNQHTYPMCLNIVEGHFPKKWCED